jgi:hypothetical protein
LLKHYAALDGNVEKLAEAVKDSVGIKITHFDGDRDQSDICAASYIIGDESVGVKDDELPTVTIVVKGTIIIHDCTIHIS